MLFYHIIILALIQGITEFLPISSSGHLVLFHEFITTNNDIYRNENFMMDVAVHVGTLFSVLLYFRNDVYNRDKKLIKALFEKEDEKNKKK